MYFNKQNPRSTYSPDDRANKLRPRSVQTVIERVQGQNTMQVDRTISVSEMGTYSIKVSSHSTPAERIMASNTQPIVMSYNYLDSSNMNAFMGSNGFALRGNKDNFFHLSFNQSLMNLKTKGNFEFKGSFNAPGVLRAGRVMAEGPIMGTSWGIQECSCGRLNNATGQYKLTHNIGHTNYFVTAVLADAGFAGMVSVVEKQSNYVVLYVRGLDGQVHNVAFEFMICGQN